VIARNDNKRNPGLVLSFFYGLNPESVARLEGDARVELVPRCCSTKSGFMATMRSTACSKGTLYISLAVVDPLFITLFKIV
jgi:hypothetical protein